MIVVQLAASHLSLFAALLPVAFLGVCVAAEVLIGSPATLRLQASGRSPEVEDAALPIAA